MYIVVGAGLAGCVAAERIANVLKEEVLIVERRGHVGGNVYDYRDEHGVLVHKYGPHAFHTKNERVWRYLSRFTGWRPYFHRVRALVDGVEVPLPFNLNSIYAVFPPRMAARLEKRLTDSFPYNSSIPILKLKETSDKDLRFLADYVYEKVFLGYTLKQWGRTPEEIDPSVTARVPVRISTNDGYFEDPYQAMPENGYSAMIENMLDNPLIRVELNTDFKDVDGEKDYDKLIYTGQIDEFCSFKLGRLPYRSLDFRLKTYRTRFFQSAAQVNYPNHFDFTRITEYKHFLDQDTEHTTVAYEYPRDYQPRLNEPYYPAMDPGSRKLYEAYRQSCERLSDVLFVGRLAEYRYYNMDEVVGRALKSFEAGILQDAALGLSGRGGQVVSLRFRRSA